MDCKMICHMLHNLMYQLKQLEVVYGYLIQNAPTEDTRRLMEINLLTVRSSLEKIEAIMHDMMEHMTPTGEAMEQVPAFANFVDAARYAFMKETQVIAMINNLMMMPMDDHFHETLHAIYVNQQLNAMRILFVLT